MSNQAQGGIPRIRNLVISTAGVNAQPHKFNGASTHLRIVPRINPLRIYFSQDDFDADENFILIAVDEVFSEPVEERCIFARGVGGDATTELLVIYKKG